MTTGDLDALRVELVRDIVATDDLDVLKAVKRTFTRALAKAKESVVREEAKKAGIKLPTAEELFNEL